MAAAARATPSSSACPELRANPSVDELVSRAREGDARAVARLISWVEDEAPQLREVMAALAPYAGHAQVVGLTGSPGVGKSTTTTALITALREQGRRVGVLAVDPSSPFTGGALLGDRVRMQAHALDPEVFIPAVICTNASNAQQTTSPPDWLQESPDNFPR